MQPQIYTGVDGHLQIGGTEIPFSAYRWTGGITTLPMWTAASSPFPDVLPSRTLPLVLIIRGFFAVDLNPSETLRLGQEVSDVIVFVNSSIKAATDFAIVVSLAAGVAEGASFFEVALTSSWKYGDFAHDSRHP